MHMAFCWILWVSHWCQPPKSCSPKSFLVSARNEGLWALHLPLGLPKTSKSLSIQWLILVSPDKIAITHIQNDIFSGNRPQIHRHPPYPAQHFPLVTPTHGADIHTLHSQEKLQDSLVLIQARSVINWFCEAPQRLRSAKQICLKASLSPQKKDPKTN